jgi:monovalent cation:H+ antiporter-2, CPA2 family
MHHVSFLQDLAVVMIVAAIVTVLFRQFKQPVVLGYILAGLIIGPHTPPFPLIADKGTIQTLSELGVIFLMFSLGLEFSLRKIKEVGASPLMAACFETLLLLWVGYQVGLLMGWSKMDSIFLGAIISISSTTIIIKALEEMKQTKERFAQLIFGMLIVEDIMAIIMIALLSGYASTGSLAASDIGKTVFQLSAFLGVLLVGGLILIPRLLNYVAKFKSNEMLLITVVGLCFGVSLLAVKLGYSVALGAFLIGAIIAEARQIAKIETLTHPVRDLFSAVFFVSIGLLIDPQIIMQYGGTILLITAVLITGKVLACSLGLFLGGNDQRTSVQVGMGLAQIGEFSFIIASLGLSLKVTSDFLYPIAVAVSALTTLLTPYLIRLSPWVVNGITKLMPVSLTNHLDAYTNWVGQLSKSRGRSGAGKFIRKWVWQILLNLLLVAGVFITLAALRPQIEQRWPDIPGGEDGLKAMLWLASMLCSLPMLIAAVRKLEALAMLISEMSVKRSAAAQNTEVMRSVVRTTVYASGCAALLLFILMLSSTILPSWKVLVAMGLLVIVALLLLRRSMIKWYAVAQVALRETLTQPPPTQRIAQPPTLPSLMRDAEIKMVTISPACPALGRMISETQLRAKTGASIVGIERAGESIINPGPDEELREGDRVLLLGSETQLAAAQLALQ